MKVSNSILDALERINVKLGGRGDDANNLVEALDQIADDLTSGVHIALDTTLTKAGEAADAKATGDAIKAAKSSTDTTLSKTGVAADAAATGYALANVSVSVDDTLSHVGQAADAKAVGDAIRNVSVDVDATLSITGMAADAKAVGDSIAVIQNAVSSPKVAESISDMTDVDNVYVYVGNESGYNSGHWYYNDGTIWRDGGVYNAVAVQTDSTLSVANMAADAKAVGDLKTDLLYKPITVENFEITPEAVEIGSSVSEVYIEYMFSKVPESATLNGDSLPIAQSDADTWTYSLNPLTSDTDFVLIGTDSGSPSFQPSSVTETRTLKFLNRIYWGVKAIGTVDSAFVKSLTNNDLSDEKDRTITVNSTSNRYIWYAYPARLGTSVFTVNGFDGGFEAPVTVSVTNNSGGTEDYYIYRSTNHTLGTTVVTIS